jgi:aldehyde:ferredoxin oxidoreductase
MIFGSRLGIDDPRANMKAQEECCQLGLDTDNTGGSIAWAIDAFQNESLSLDDTGGVELQWGDHPRIISLLKKIAYREGLGDLLAEGSVRASRIIGKGSERFVFAVKGQELVEAIRSCKGWALGIVVSPRGASHTRGAPYSEFRRWSPEDSEKTFGVATAGDPTTYEGKAHIVTYYEAVHALWDSLGICFPIGNWAAPDGVTPEELADLYGLATGTLFSEKELMEIGERIHTLEKLFNVYHAGFTRDHDYPPRRLMEEPIKSGPMKGELLKESDWNRMLDEYYAFHGWDVQTGWPTRDNLRELGLQECIPILSRAEKMHAAKLQAARQRQGKS